jgi:hypothetical protein
MIWIENEFYTDDGVSQALNQFVFSQKNVKFNLFYMG